MSEISGNIFRDVKSDKKRERKSDISKEVSDNHISYEEFMKTVKKTRILPYSYENIPNFGERSQEHPIKDTKEGKKKVQIEKEQTFNIYSGDIRVDKVEESNKSVSYEDFLRSVKKTRITPLLTEGLPNFEMKPLEQIKKESIRGKEKIEDNDENVLIFKSKSKEKDSEKIKNLSKKSENKTKKEPINKSDEKVKEERPEVEGEKKKEITKSKEDILEEKQKSKEINQEKDKSEEKIKPESFSVNDGKKDLTSEKQKSQDIKREGEKMDYKQEKEESERKQNDIEQLKKYLEKKIQEKNSENSLIRPEGYERTLEKVLREQKELEEKISKLNKNLSTSEKINQNQEELKSNRTEDISNKKDVDIKNKNFDYKPENNIISNREIGKSKENVEYKKEVRDIPESYPKMDISLINQIIEKIDEGNINNIKLDSFEIPKDCFYIVKNAYYCKDINFLKKVYEREKSFRKTEKILKEVGCKNVPSKYTIEKIVRESFNSREKYNTWKENIKSKGFFYTINNEGHSQWRCKDIDLLKKLYENVESNRKIEIIFKELGCNNVPSYETINQIIQRSFNSKEEYNSWRMDIKLKKIQEIAIEKGGKCKSTEYEKNRIKMLFECKKGHKFEMEPGNLKAGHWCPQCGGTQKLRLKDFQKIAEERGGKCKAHNYKNARTKLIFECANGHEFKMKAQHIKAGHWCPTCSEGTSERICRGLFETIFNKEFKKVKPEWLKNSKGHQLELDGYNKELKLAFECQGRQHYEFPNHCHKTIADFITQKFNDIQKGAQVKEHGIILIEVPTSVEHDKKQKYIIEQCRLKGVEVSEIKSKIDWSKFKWKVDDDVDDDNRIKTLKDWLKN